MEIEIGTNLKEILLALVALLGTVAGYYFGYKRGVSNSFPDKVKKQD